MSLQNKKELLDWFPGTRICMHYGLTEASRSTFLEFHDTDHLDSAGKPVNSQVDVAVFDNSGNKLPQGESGEIGIKGNMVSPKYLDETKSDINIYRFGEFIRTGDTGFLDEEGYLHIIGREKEIINVGGKKVSPAEVEEAVCSLGVGDCVCIPVEDSLMGERVKCLVLKGSTSLSFEEIFERLKSILQPYKIPTEFDWIDSIPKTESGKKQRLLINQP